MRSVSFYHKDTGIIADRRMVFSDPDAISLNTPVDHIVIDGHHDHLCRRVNVETGELIDYQPPQPSPDHEWDVTTKRWNINAEIQERQQKQLRASAELDRLEKKAIRMLIEITLGDLTQLSRLTALNAQIAKLREDL